MHFMSKFNAQVVNVGKAHRIGTVETFKVKSTGRRLYMNLDKDLIEAYGIQRGDILKVEIKERIEPDQPGNKRPNPGNVRLSENPCIRLYEKPGRRLRGG